MSRLSAICIIIATLITGLASCNSSSSNDYDLEGIYSSAIVKNFYIKENDSVLENLQNVFFSIDLNNGQIFNADSMPYGTDIHALVPSITTNGASSVELVVPRPGLTDSIHDYLTNSTDSIDFSNGPVKLRVLSYDGLTTMEYSIKVNVHKIKSDSLSWGNAAFSKLPTSLASVKEQHTVKFNGHAYCLTTDGTNYCIAHTPHPATQQWATDVVSFGFTPEVNSFRASSDALYILDNNHKLYKSTDALNWASTDHSFDYLIGAYGDKIIGTVLESDGTWKIADTDGGSTVAPEGFPVYGSSLPVEYGFEMSSSRQLTIVGGFMANDRLTDCCWGYDGNKWACISTRPMPVALEGATVVPYFIFEENSFFIASKYSIFIAFGGYDEHGFCNDKVYISYNYGMSWAEASELMQLPAEVPPMAYAQALIFSSQISRASVAITQWDCPYIYLFGGQDAAFNTFDTVWRAVINRLQFKPLQ